MGGDKVADILGQLKSLQGSLTGGIGSGVGGSAGISKAASDTERLTKQVQAGTVGVHALGKALKNLGETPGVNISLGGKMKGGVDPEKWKSILSKMSPEDRAREEALAAQSNSPKGGGRSKTASKYKGVYWSSKQMELMQFPQMPSWIENLPAGSPLESIHGLKEITGKDLAKIAGLPDVNDVEKELKARASKDVNTFKKDMSFLMMPLFNPGSMWATMFSGRQTFSALNTATGASFLKNKMGGISAGMATGVLVGAATAVGLALKALGAVVSETTKSFENARQLYAKALTGGMGLGFTAKRSMVANIMGVSETEVFRFGSQMAYLNPRLQQASEILAKTAGPLTQVSWEFKILQADLSAMFSKLASDMAPAIDNFIVGLDKLVQFLTRNVGLFEKMWIATNPALYLGFKLFQKKYSEADQSKMPGITSWMKQLPASSWEKMGLQVGPNANNYARQTAQNTRQMARDLGIIAQSVSGGGGGSLFRGVGAGGSWGISPQQNAP